MSGRAWMIRSVVALSASIGIGFGLAEAGVILPVDPVTRQPISGSQVTVSIFQGSVDVTDSWLPEPGQTVQIVVNGLTSPTISPVLPGAGSSVVPPTTLTTSAYPGVCTNFGSDTGGPNFPDFTLVGDQLTSNDCGGMAVIQVTGGGSTYTFVLPQDTDFDGLPDIWEGKYCPSPSVTCLDPMEDGTAATATTPRETGTEQGDGFRIHDEYRGFVVSPDDATPGFIFTNPIPRKHIRTSPLVKDIFIHPVKGQCQPGGPIVPSVLDSYPAPITPATTVRPSATSGTGVTFTAGTGDSRVFRTSQIGGLIINLPLGTGKARITGISGTSDPTVATTVVTADIIEPFPSTATILSGSWQVQESLFAAFYTLFPPTQVHLLSTTPGTPKSDQWVDTFVSLSIGAPTTPTANVATFAFTFDSNNPSIPGPLDRQVNQNSVVGSPPQKGARLIECLNNQFSSPVGAASWEPLTTGFDNAIIYTRRIANPPNSADTPWGFIDSKVAAGGSRQLVVQIKMCIGASRTCPWTTIFAGSSTGPTPADKDFVKTKYLQYIVAMELAHSIQVNPVLSTYGVHDSPDSGDILGSNAQIVVSTKQNTFQIPALFLKSADRDFHLH